MNPKQRSLVAGWFSVLTWTLFCFSSLFSIVWALIVLSFIVLWMYLIMFFGVLDPVFDLLIKQYQSRRGAE